MLGGLLGVALFKKNAAAAAAGHGGRAAAGRVERIANPNQV